MRVLYLTEERISFSDAMVRGGAIHVQRVVQGLRNRGHDVFLVDWNEASERPFQHSVDPALRFVDGPARTLQRAISVGDTSDIDVIVSKTRKTYVPGLLAARRLGIPHVVHVGSSLDRPTASLADRIDQFSFRVRLRAPHDGYLVVCDYIAGQLRDRGIDADQVFDVKNAVDTNRFHPETVLAPLSKSLRDRLAAQRDDRLTLGYVGGLQPIKGLDDLRTAVQEVDADVNVVVAGDGPIKNRLEREFGDDGCFLGAVPYEQVPALYHEFDMFVLPSHTEGLPRVILEAQSTATPVIATRVGGVPEVVTDGETGLLCRPQAPGELATAIDRIAVNDAKRVDMARNGRTQVIDRFTWGALFERYERFLQTLVERNRSN